MSKLISCPSCGAEIAKSADICPKCGAIAKGKSKTCKSCGKEILKTAVVCPNCGAKQKKKHPFIGVMFLFVAIILFAAAIASAGSHNDTTKSTYSVGDTVEYSGIAVTLKSTNELPSSGFIAPADGNTYLVCEFEIANNSNHDIAVSTLLCFDAYADNYATPLSITAIAASGQPQLDAQVASGKKINGVVGYEVPQGWTEFEIRVAPDFWLGKKISFVVNH